jgi:hypothetical protein
LSKDRNFDFSGAELIVPEGNGDSRAAGLLLGLVDDLPGIGHLHQQAGY